MKRILINGRQQEELRVASVDGQRLYNLDIENTSRNNNKGNIYKAAVTRIEPSLEAAFVDFGFERHGFLPLKEISKEYLKDGVYDKNSTIKDMLKEGQELIVQIEREQRGNKGAALTTFVSLAGKYLVLMPNNPKAGGVSRRIEGEDRKEVKNILNQLKEIDSGGNIIRTAGVGKSLEELQWDQDYLTQLWSSIKESAFNKKAPFLIYRESNIIIRTLRDHMDDTISEILVDEKNVYERAKEFLELTMPQNLKKLQLYEDKVPLFSKYQIESQIESAFNRHVSLPSGGSLIIDHTEALISIDINSAKSTKGSDIEETALNTNLEAAEEIARQLRIRDLGGLVVVDFIDMLSLQNQKKVENKFREAVKLDKARVQLGKISRFGLLELSRQRLRLSLRESNEQLCHLCEGIGKIRNTKSIALATLRLVEDELLKEQTTKVVAELPIDVSTYLINEKSNEINVIKEKYDSEVIIVPNPHLERPKYIIKRYRSDNDETIKKSSYELINGNGFEYQYENDNEEEKISAAIEEKDVKPAKPIPVSKPSVLSSLFKAISKMFSPEPKKKKPTRKYYKHRKNYRPHKGNKYQRNRNQDRRK